MSSKYLQKQVAKAKSKKEQEAKDIAEAFKRSEGVKKGNVLIPSGDIHRKEDQNFMVISYCTADGSTRVKSVKDLAMKFSPAFRTLPEADKWCQIIRDENPLFDVLVVDMYEWGVVPLPNEQRPFVETKYANEILSKAVLGLQRSMVRNKKDMDERKTREMAAAEREMQKLKGKDYKMPEKSHELKTIEERIQKERDQQAQALTEGGDAAAEIEVAKFSLSEVTEIVMEYCKEHNGDTIDPVTGAMMTQFIAKRSLEIEAQIRRAKAAEFKEEDPRNMPTAQELHDAKEAEQRDKPVDFEDEHISEAPQE